MYRPYYARVIRTHKPYMSLGLTRESRCTQYKLSVLFESHAKVRYIISVTEQENVGRIITGNKNWDFNSNHILFFQKVWLPK